MEKFKSAVLIFSIVVEIAAIVLFVNKEISSTLLVFDATIFMQTKFCTTFFKHNPSFCAIPKVEVETNLEWQIT